MPRCSLPELLDLVEVHYGRQAAGFPMDPVRFFVRGHSGYAPSEERCRSGFEALVDRTSINPESLLATRRARLAKALKSGGLVAELRAARLHEIARQVVAVCDGSLERPLESATVTEARRFLKSLPGIGDRGADRFLLFAGRAPVPAVPSCRPHTNCFGNFDGELRKGIPGVATTNRR